MPATPRRASRKRSPRADVSSPAKPPARRKSAPAKAAPKRKPVAAKTPPRLRLLSDERRAQLLELGIEMFAAQPYDEVRIDEVARRCGISKGLLYHYFPTKRDFYSATLRAAAERLLIETQIDSRSPPIERLREGLGRYLGFVSGYAAAYVTLMRGGIGADPTVAAIIEETRVRFMERLLAGMGFAPEPPPLLRLALRGWIGCVEAASLDWVVRRDVSQEALCELLARQLLAALIAGGSMAPDSLPAT